MARTDSIGAIGDDAARVSAYEMAREVILNRRTEEIRDSKQVAVGRDAPNVTTSATYSPVIYAQAASLQLYTQAGVMASTMGNNQSATNARLLNGRPPPIRAVDSARGTNLNSLA